MFTSEVEDFWLSGTISCWSHGLADTGSAFSWLGWMDIFLETAVSPWIIPGKLSEGNITFWSICGGGRWKGKPCHVVNLPIFCPQLQLDGAAIPSPKAPRLGASGGNCRWQVSVYSVVPLCKCCIFWGGDYLSLSINMNRSWLSCLVSGITGARRRGARRGSRAACLCVVAAVSDACFWAWFCLNL